MGPRRFQGNLGEGEIWMFPKIGGKPLEWMVKIMENHIKIQDFGGTIFFGNTHMIPFGQTCDEDVTTYLEDFLPCRIHGQSFLGENLSNHLNPGSQPPF